jgi:signal transduction histidine kinase
MLLDTPLLDEQRELTNTIRISGTILLSTVSNFLDFFKVQAGKKLDIVRTPFYLTDIVADAHAIVDVMMGTNRQVCGSKCFIALWFCAPSYPKMEIFVSFVFLSVQFLLLLRDNCFILFKFILVHFLQLPKPGAFTGAV